MEIIFRKKFRKQFSKLPPKVSDQFERRLELLLQDVTSPLLKIHTLTGSRYPLKSMNVTADYRALFLRTKDTIIFYEIGSHSGLYG